ncbi:MAG TPA: magnesium/cobalt transporter CorA [Chloroflexota bacterium]
MSEAPPEHKQVIGDDTVFKAKSATHKRRGLTCQVFKHGERLGQATNLTDISDLLRHEDHLVWLDAVDPNQEDLDLIKEEFGLHPLAVEDAVHAHQRPKIETYGNTWFVVVQATTVEVDRIQFHEMAIFVGEQFLVTVRHTPALPLEEIEKRWNNHPEELRRGTGFLLYTILDTVVDGYLPVAQRFEDRVDVLEEDLFRDRPMQREVLPRIFEMKREAQRFRWAAMPMRDILNPIIRKDIDIFPEDTLAYFRDVYDHAVRVIDQLDNVRDLVSSALEIHLSVISNRQNEVAKQLTIIATIFLPLTFLTGFFGQNFTLLVTHIITPAWTFWVFGIGLELLALTLTLGYFKWKRWF